MIRHILLISAALVLFASCNDSSTGSSGLNSRDFFLRITMKTSKGNPVPGLRVSSWNLYPGQGFQKARLQDRIEKTTASSSIGFDVPVAAGVSLTILEIDDRVVTPLVDNRVLKAGAYVSTFQINDQAGTHVYKCRMASQDTASGARLFADSIYIVLWQPDAFFAILGSTSAAGTIETRDSLRFPNVLSLPPLIRTTIDPTPLELFSIPDSVVIVAMDTVAQRLQEFRCVVRKGFNDLSFVWSPPTPVLSAAPPSIIRSETRIAVERSGVPTAWKLRQNYPNPFN
ncbi:MAG TPA: hypothetical protein VI758_02220 [Bacteroidota bacterium]